MSYCVISSPSMECHQYRLSFILSAVDKACGVKGGDAQLERGHQHSSSIVHVGGVITVYYSVLCVCKTMHA